MRTQDNASVIFFNAVILSGASASRSEADAQSKEPGAAGVVERVRGFSLRRRETREHRVNMERMP
jgi:hypothetical protein